MIDINQYHTLIKRIHVLNFEYYTLSNPSVSDAEYDSMFRELVEWEDKNPSLIAADSPTQTVGTTALDRRFTPVRRSIPMLSIKNAFEENNLRSFIHDNEDSVRLYGACVEPKIDGLAVELTYKEGSLVQASTRGDGETGEDITANILAVESIPNRIDESGIVDVRGEVLMSRPVFDSINQGLDKKFANCRNAAAGSLKQLDLDVVRSRQLSFMAYGVGRSTRSFTRQSDILDHLRKLGFDTTDFKVLSSLDDCIRSYNQWLDSRGTIDYDIDGVVFKLNSIIHANQLGNTSRYPRSCIAYKFPASEDRTKLESVTIQVGRTGALTPVAELAPVELHGVTVSRATLHNWDEIELKDIRVGDTVLVQRAGDVIPAIVAPDKTYRDGSEEPIPRPTSCPACGGQVRLEKAIYRCISMSCPVKLSRSAQHFVSRNALDVIGLGKRLVSELVDRGLISQMEDLLSLTKTDLLELDNVGPKRADKILSAIQTSIAECTEDRLLFALGVRHLGKDVSKLLLCQFGTIEEVFKQRVDSITSVQGIGDTIAESIADAAPDILARMPNIRQCIKPVTKKSEAKSDSLAGTTIVLTGTFDRPRSDIKKYLVSNGAKVTGSVSNSTTWVLIGDKPGRSKVTAAENKGVPLATLDQIQSIVGKS